jgi:hypothetical protein
MTLFPSRAEETLLRTLGHCGAVTVRQIAQSDTPVSARWLSSFAQQTGLVTVATSACRGQDIRHVTLTVAGKQAVRETLGFIPYRSAPAQILHDLTLSGYYLRLPPDVRATWRNPEELLAEVRHRYQTRLRSSYPDGLHDGPDGVVAVEIAGNRLTRTQLSKKQFTAWGQWNAADLVVIRAGEYSDVDF